ncbi:MAG TPA: hypothetical protein P5280_13795 [Cyclobacteriaceae bacterium]|nr:hypothetical protein [Cyclobacteriaceae bacterium]
MEPPEKENNPVVNTSRPWKRYLLEFIFIFLAVFLGFLADNFREEYFERQQATQLARSFYEELKNDSIAASNRVQGRVKKERAIEYMVSFFRDSALNSSSKSLSINFLWATTVRTPVIFTPRTVVLEQLKSSGTIRYFKSSELRNLVGELSIAIDYIIERQATEASVYQRYIEPIMITHMDYDFQNKLFHDGIFDQLSLYENGNDYIPFHLTQIDKIDRQALINALSYYHTNNIKSTRMIPFKDYLEVNAKLLAALRKEYQLD